MTEHPVLFTAPMVRAILEGRKTVTRRPVTVRWGGRSRCQPYEPWFVEEDGRLLVDCSEAMDSFGNGDYREFSSCMPCPYGVPGDTLWVRETWACTQNITYYRATDDGLLEPGAKWRPSIHMPRWAARLILEVTDVRVERLQGLTEEQAMAEGCTPVPFCSAGVPVGNEHVEGFRELWDTVYTKGPYVWAQNPWVWAVSFRRLQ